MTRILTTLLGCAVFTLMTSAQAAVQTKTIKYKHGELECVGFLAFDDAIEGKRPGVLVVHEWWGLDDYARQRTEKLAALGYVAFAADMYGAGKVAKHPQEAGAMAMKVRENTEDWQKRGVAALEVLKSQPQCDTEKLGAIGYCFGGSTVLQLALSGVDLDAVASFHGALPMTTAEQAKKAKATMLVCHGAQDSFIPETAIQQFRQALDAAGADWEMVYYAGARHSFTVADAGKHGIEGMKYSPTADARSWQHMRELFKEKLGK